MLWMSFILLRWFQRTCYRKSEGTRVICDWISLRSIRFRGINCIHQTIQQVDILNELVAEPYTTGELKPGTFAFDSRDNVITIGKFSPSVDKEFIQRMIKQI